MQPVSKDILSLDNVRRCPSYKKIGFLLVDTEVKVRYGGDDVVEDIGLDIFVWNPVGCGEEVEFEGETS